MNKRVASELAVGVILILAIIIGEIVWLGNKQSDLNKENTLTGLDLNNNNVRDDIDDYIINNYTVASQSAAAMQAAKAMQKSLLVDTSNLPAVREVMTKLNRAIHCVYLQFDGKNNSKQPAQVFQEIESMTTNTKQRLKAYLTFNKTLDGTAWGTPTEDICE